MPPPTLSQTPSPPSEDALARALTGGPLVIPTETYYGLATNPCDEAAVAALMALKQRPGDKALPLIAADRAAVEAVAELPAPLAALANALWPAPLTLALPAKEPSRWPDTVLGPGDTLGIRLSPHPAAAAVATAARRMPDNPGLITATSANLSGQPAVADLHDLAARVRAGASLVVEGGRLPGGAPSTGVGVDATSGVPRVWRCGAVGVDELNRVLAAAGFPPCRVVAK